MRCVRFMQVKKLTAENAQLKVAAAASGSNSPETAAASSAKRQLEALEQEKKMVDMQLASERQERAREITQAAKDLAAAQEELAAAQVCQPSCAARTSWRFASTHWQGHARVTCFLTVGETSCMGIMRNVQARLKSLEAAGPDANNKMLLADMDALKAENQVLKNLNESLEGTNERYKRELDAAIKAVQEARELEAAHAQARKNVQVRVEEPSCVCV